ncbi:MAG: hypothetical protein C0507_23605 [Cyanobacteria bacterium PR.3.49]|nr:hypothetical protein [Cyanobacteria bacterium PR.3.49]
MTVYRSKLPAQMVLLISLLLVIIIWSSDAFAPHGQNSLQMTVADGSMAVCPDKAEGLDSHPAPHVQRHFLMVSCNQSVGVPCIGSAVEDSSALSTQNILLAPRQCIFALQKLKDSSNIPHERNFPLWLRLQVILI